MNRYICIHAHFYQPPRENPWLGAIELQDSAYPYHDWNEKITSQCYATNAGSRILDQEGRIIQIVNNYAGISYNFGPTLLSWMENKAHDVYDAVLTADRISRDRYSGHGSALAQAYNHMILPLANRLDKITQIIWGIRDFEHRFDRSPEGMWLPETAVDLETLDILAEQGIRFTILAPRQANRVRPLKEGNWQDVSGEKIDPAMPYLQKLPSGRTIALFFYDGPISRAVAFEGLLSKGETFARRIMDGFSKECKEPQIVHIATDGESYGHHHRHGDMALAYALHYIESKNLARLTNYGEYLEKHPPTHEVEIFENSSWSCVHGIERWRSDCGCNSGGHPDWSQAWRAPLRKAMDWLRDSIAPDYEKVMGSFLNDPWAARNDYIQVVLDRSPENLQAYLNRYGLRDINDQEKVTVLKLLELQRNAMLMYTSCGWFFDELSGLETVQIIQYAGRALQLAQDIFGDNREIRFLELLEQAESNIPSQGNGRRIYDKFVKPAMVDLKKVGAHYAMSSIFKDYPKESGIYCYSIDREMYKKAGTGKANLAAGCINVVSKITREAEKISFGIFHWGDHNLSGFIRKWRHKDFTPESVKELFEIFSKADFPKTLEWLQGCFGESTCSLGNLFKDEKMKILDIILESTRENIDSIYHEIHENYAPLLPFLKELNIPRSKVLYTAVDAVFDHDLQRAFEKDELDPEAIKKLLSDADLEGASFDAATLEMSVRKKLERMAAQFHESSGELPLLQKLEKATGLLEDLPFEVNIRTVQNKYYAILQQTYPRFQKMIDKGNDRAEAWIKVFSSLGEKLSVRVE